MSNITNATIRDRVTEQTADATINHNKSREGYRVRESTNATINHS
jgi:hypothetical protein